MSYRQDLWAAIARDPVKWIELADFIKSRKIFTECVYHAAGQYKQLYHTPLPEKKGRHLQLLDQKIQDIIAKKAYELSAMCRGVEQVLVTTYPANMERSTVTGRADRDNISKASYSNDIMSWMALSLFRQWLMQALVNVSTLSTECSLSSGGPGLANAV